MRADWIEVTQDDDVPLFVLGVHVREDTFHHVLGFSIGVLDSLGLITPLRANVPNLRVLIEGTLGISIYSTRGGEN